MDKIISIDKAIQISNKLKKDGKKTVLVGGCFDIFHYGHFVFLKEARKKGDALFIALENDDRVKKLKGENRPITPQGARAEILASFPFVDYVFILPTFSTDNGYHHMTLSFKPAVIALTQGDKNLDKKEKFAKEVGASIAAIDHVKTPSTTELHKIMTTEL